MAWFDDLKRCLAQHYDATLPADTVGFLQGSDQPSVWRQMEMRSSGQMIVLGNRPPTPSEWGAAGVAQRGMVQEIKLHALAGFFVVYGGFMFRPWGHIITHSPVLEQNLYPSSLQSWTYNAMPPRRK